MEPEPTPEQKKPKLQVLAEAKANQGKMNPSATRAKKRAHTMALVKQVKDLVEALGPHQKEAIQVLIDQLTAMRGIYHQGIKCDEVPDQVIRQKASIVILEWLHGKPREFQMQVTGGYDDLGEMLEKLRNSEEWARISGQKTVLGQEIPPALPDATREEGERAN